MTAETNVLIEDKQPLDHGLREPAEAPAEQKPPGKSAAGIFAGQLTDAVTLLLIAAAAVSAFTGAFSDALPIMLMALLNTAAGFYGEYKSERTLMRISKLTDRPPDITDAPLTRETRRIARVLTGISLAGCAVCFALSLLRGAGAVDSFYISASLLIASVSQGIRPVCVITAAAAMERSLKSGAAIGSCGTLERLASVGTVCTEKTGILTDGYVSAAALAVLSDKGFKEYRYSEAESRLTGGSYPDGFRAWEDSALSRVLICAAVCNNARRVRTEPSLKGRNRGRRTYYDGDPCESALLRLCSSCGIERELLLCERISETPFDPAAGYMLVTVREAKGRTVSYVKGAPERISALCTVSEGVQTQLEMLCGRYGAAGMRLLAFGMNSGSGWQLLGLAALRESLRPQCAERIRRLRRAGVSVLLLSGDHPQTVKAAAARAGILTPDSVALTGAGLDRMTDEQLYDSVRSISLVSRASREQRERVVSMLRSRGVRCAFAASGTPAAADVTISVSDKNADVLLAGGGISAIAEAVSESRAALENTARTVCCMISSELGILITAVSSAALGMPLFGSCHLLAAALLCGSFPALLLTSAPAPSPDRLDRPAGERHFAAGSIAEAAGRGVLTALCTLGCCSVLLKRGCPLPYVQSAALLTLVLSHCMVFLGFAGSFNARGRAVRALIPPAILSLMMFLPPLGSLFRLYFPGAKPAALSLLAAMIVPAAGYIRKRAEKVFGSGK